MPKLPVIRAYDLFGILKKEGFVLDRVRGSHHSFIHPARKLTISVPSHKGKTLGKGITLAILKDAEIIAGEFLSSTEKGNHNR